MEAMDVKYPNGSVEKVRQAAAAPALEAVTYKVCRKNHALATGGHTVDGCGEWMPLGDLNLADASSYNCAACGCHRSFHWKVMTEGSPPPPAMAATVLHGLPENDDERSVSPPQQPPPAPHPTPVTQQPPAYISSAPHMLPSLNSSAPGAPQNQRLPVQLSPATEPPPHGVMPARKKRTKFTDEQKQRMQELSERLGWRLQKRDAGIVDDGCRDIGVSKVVFKVWMHNNKHNYLIGRSARRNASAAASSAATTPPAAPFNPSTSHSSPVPTATGFNMNGTASSASTASPIIAGGGQVNGASSQAQQSA